MIGVKDWLCLSLDARPLFTCKLRKEPRVVIVNVLNLTVVLNRVTLSLLQIKNFCRDIMDNSSEQRCPSLFMKLPYDVIITIFEHCDVKSLGRLARTCKTFNKIIHSEDSVWKISSLNVFGSNMAAQAMQYR